MRVIFLFLVVFSVLFSKVDINHASKNELMSLQNVGAKKADAIINYRDQKCFDSIDELAKVKGIGQSTLTQNKEMLEVTTCKK